MMMENINLKKSETTLVLISSIFLIISHLPFLIRQFSWILNTYKLYSASLPVTFFKYLFWSLNYWSFILLALCGIFLVYTIQTILRKNSLNTSIIKLKKILFIALIVFSGAKILNSLRMILLAFTGTIQNTGISRSNMDIIQMILGISEYIFTNIILPIGIILFCAVVLKTYKDDKFSKTALYFSIGGAAGVLVTGLIRFIMILPYIIDRFNQQQLFGTTTEKVLMEIAGNIQSLLIPVAIIIIIKFGIKYSESLQTRKV